ncbi:MAG: DUF255 domain-containing protein [Candidatus Obscuribacterales bacterium]|nr:DUF255 domain-containing protein [Candidatus Obscuribacterales bacterium]
MTNQSQNLLCALSVSLISLLAFADPLPASAGPPSAAALASSKGAPKKTSQGVSKEAAHGASKVIWNDWSDDVFARAKKEGKLVLLDLEAVWCHWCHVMDEKTYADSAVAKLMDKNIIAIKVDQDSRPDLSNKYEKYGWPATIIFNAEGKELAKRSGYIDSAEFKSLIKKLAQNPDKPEPDAVEDKIAYTANNILTAEQRKDLNFKHVDGYDADYGGWGIGGHKFLDWNSAEYSLQLAKGGDKDALERVRKTLDAHNKLIDPVFGGVYQYSTNGDWDHPHFEKIMETQAECLRLYALAGMVLQEKKYIDSAKSIESYLKNFMLSPDGAFYTSQDADLKPGEHSAEYFALNDKDRRARGIPRIDKHVYARENGWAINAIAFLYMATGEPAYLTEAEKAAQWVIANRSIEGGGFRHDESDRGGPFLGDTLSMGRAFLSLYQATGDQQWLKRATRAADFIAQHFENKEAGKEKQSAGFLTAEAKPNSIAVPEPLLEENQSICRFANLLGVYTGEVKYKQMAESAMRYLSTPAIVAKRRILVAGTLIADHEMGHVPAHITVVGKKSDPQAKDLFIAAVKSPLIYKRIDWLDKSEGNLPNLDVDFPDLGKAAAFLCAGNRCSSPAYRPEDLEKLIERVK